jgi:hypothetical protein
MKRFYCTECKRVKRVRQYPTSVIFGSPDIPTNRIGHCDYHITGRVKANHTHYATVSIAKRGTR